GIEMDTTSLEVLAAPNGGPAAFDPFYNEFKHADTLPLWLKLQHEIRTKLDKLMAEASRLTPALFQERIKSVNDTIAAYNDNVPNVYLRKPKLTPANWSEQYDNWQ